VPSPAAVNAAKLLCFLTNEMPKKKNKKKSKGDSKGFFNHALTIIMSDFDKFIKYAKECDKTFISDAVEV
jgi:hypothetical protein